MVGRVPGFLRTRPYPDRTPGSGGNLALKDIAMGLRWVRENIAAFGGDPTKITLIGHDTGAALANLLLLAPYGKGDSGVKDELQNQTWEDVIDREPYNNKNYLFDTLWWRLVTELKF
ncbi:hypothetical protein E2986_13775 [Frieseomelitta varia]|uniref:Carboxylesterase type B domain-containing protein n=1 Tax=Frieseomelitta varia TaxID=561572 RepID=A0A833SG64_9HYME|nr:hypothetical protein E2986_13775 [Frieseomelitta varia]